MIHVQFTGFALISSDVNIQIIKSRFHIYQVTKYNIYHDYEQGLIKYFILSLPFLLHGRFILKEILRLLEISCLHYFHKVIQSVIPEVMQMMFPIRPRELLEYPDRVDLDDQETPSAFYFINKRITSLLQATNHVRAVVVGTSSVGLSFIENLIFDRTPVEPCFTRVTLLTKHGLWHTPHRYQALAESVIVHDGETAWNQVESMGLGMWVTVRHGILTEINVQEKYVITNNNQYKLNYEYLFIVKELDPILDPVSKMKIQKDIITSSKTLERSDMSDTNITRKEAFQKFTQKSKHISHRRCETNLDVTKRKIVADEVQMENVFNVSNVVNIAHGLDYVDRMVHKREHIAPILIIGNTLQVFACVHSVLSLGVREAGMFFNFHILNVLSN